MQVRSVAGAAAALLLLGTAAQPEHHTAGSFKLTISAGPVIAGSRLAIDAAGADGPLTFALVGPGSLRDQSFVAPAVQHAATSTLVAAAGGAVASATVSIVPPPAARRSLLAVATYDDGIALHDSQTFALLGYAPIGGPPGDVAFSGRGDIYAPDTDGETLARVERSPWRMNGIAGVPSGNEVIVDPRTHDVFVSDRDLGGKGALTRITPDGAVTKVVTGDTAEGLALDASRGTIYVGNVNDATVAQVDEASMKIVRRIGSVERTFGIALDSRAQRLYVVSNTSPTMHAGGGFVAAIDLRAKNARIVAKSMPMTFPLGIVLDRTRDRLFVTDESTDRIAVLNARTLAPARAAIATCRTPWRPRIAQGRLFVPCARSNQVDVFDLRTMRRVHGAPFATGGFPLSVALWP